MTFPRIRNTGQWTDTSVVDPDEFEAFDENQSNALDGDAGGAYAPSPALTIGGDGLILTSDLGGNFEFTGTPTWTRIDQIESDLRDMIVSNLIYTNDFSSLGLRAIAFAWDGTRNRWIEGGTNTSEEPVLSYSDGVGRLWGSDVALPSPNNTQVNGIAIDDNTIVLSLETSLSGASSTQQWIRQSSNGGSSWTARSWSGTANGLGVGPFGVKFILGSLFVITRNAASPATNNVETSSDGITWTSRTLPTSAHRFGVTSSPTLALITNNATTDAYASSPDGSTWTARTFPASGQDWTVYYSAYHTAFFAMSSDGSTTTCLKSTDGISWTTQTSSASFDGRTARWSNIHDHLVVASNDGGVRVSVDEGTTWRLLADFAAISAVWQGENQILVSSAEVSYAGLKA